MQLDPEHLGPRWTCCVGLRAVPWRSKRSVIEVKIDFREHTAGNLREAPFNNMPPLFGHCPFGGGGLDPCPDGLGHFFREEFSKFKRAFA